MVNTLGYKDLILIHYGANSRVYRGKRLTDNQSVILKILNTEYPTPIQIRAYRQEFHLTHKLKLSKVITAHELEERQRMLGIIIEDFGGISIKHWLDKRQEGLSLEEFLPLAIQITEGLAQLHNQYIIHKDINPSNIVINPETGMVKIIDLGIATELNRESLTLKNPNVLEGTLSYISPEQTGRMNRDLDYRTDFYSLGVTFYELLTGQLPFNTKDNMELVHCHIAKQATPPHQINKEIFPVIADIVMKLMAKNAEERYQSAWGIKADLEQCLEQYEATKNIESFPLSTQDMTERFQIPQKLYGRQEEIESLLAAFNRVAQAPSNQENPSPREIIIVTGSSGIGKSALVQELHKPVTAQRGFFLAGKFDQLQRNIPYSALVIAFTGLIRQLLGETEVKIKQWKEKILKAVGSNGQVMINVIPELELIIGPQPYLAELAAIETQNRFNLVFQNFTGVFCSQEHPLVIFLDDLQWADVATLRLIELIITDMDSQHLLFLGSYRHNEVDDAHILSLTLDKLQKQQVKITQISLQPLESEHICNLIQDTLQLNNESILPLADLVYKKTQGNPFFVNQFLSTLHDENLLRFNHISRSWEWDIREIDRLGITDNVVDLMVRKVKQLPPICQRFLSLAACIGSEFELQLLSMIDEQEPVEVYPYLLPVMYADLILPTSELNQELWIETYRFSHDRIEQAAYSLLSETEKKKIHLKIGESLLGAKTKEQLEFKLFSMVDHLNKGVEFAIDNQREEIAALNLEAGKKALAATASFAGANYLKMGRVLLGESGWTTHYQLTLDLHIEAMEAEYLCGNYEGMQDLFKVVQSQAQTILAQIKAYEILINFNIAQNQMKRALDIGLEVLNSLGIQLNELPPVVENLELLYNLEKLTNPTQLAALKILLKICNAAYNVNPSLMVKIIFTMVNICLLYGNSSFAPSAYVCYGLFYCSIDNYELGYQYAKVALKLLDRSDTKMVNGQVKFNFNSFIRHWKEPIKNIVNSLNDLILNCLEVGDFEHASYVSIMGCFLMMFGKEPLDVVINNQIVLLTNCQKLQNVFPIASAQIWTQMADNFRQNFSPNHNFSGIFFDEKSLPSRRDIKTKNIFYPFYLAKTIISYTFKDFANSICYVQEIGDDEHISTLPFAIRYVYHSLSLLAMCSVSEEKTCIKYLEQVEINQKKMKIWAEHAPMNFQHYFDLVEAEKARVLGQVPQAIQLYERAIENAHEQGFLHQEAMAYELAAEFYLSQGIKRIGLNYLKEAYYCYQKWGAIAKIQALEIEYPDLCLYSSTPRDSLTTTESTLSNNQESLDLATVIKATQAISSEIVLPQLLLSLMNILLENAGAQRGALILQQDNNLFVEIIKNADSSESVVLSSLPLSVCNCLSQKVVNYVFRTQEILILNNAKDEGNFTDDPYIQKNQSQSILCAPFINQGKFQGIIYLENNLSIKVFTPERLEMVKLLCSQAAISIENARLYDSLEKRVEERTLELAKANEELNKLANMDALTQIANRGCFNNYLSQQWEQHAQEQQPLGLIMLDVDYFKRYNDFYGHQGGDDCLRKIAQVIAQTVKGVVDLVARYGGEEFAVILPNSNIENSLMLAESIRQAVKILKIPHAQSEISPYVTLSLGVASLIPTIEQSLDELIANADRALYAAKKSGRDQVFNFHQLSLD